MTGPSRCLSGLCGRPIPPLFLSFLPPSSALYSFLLLSAALVWVYGEQEVADLRLKSSSYCQEVSDLQEALQWKDKKIGVWFHSVLYDFQT